ncbi:type II toxin-antitoxin system VapC family toxin [Parerythrobacter aurantius]|uniref:type II toxin-antitoxin system VapC family toxin n=1 Tax=Parerythrobacter aurantius TaxID=3127706 RepID=UPI0032557C18
MICVDTSAVIAVLLDEEERDHFSELMSDADQLFMSAGSLIELRIVCRNRGGDWLVSRAELLLAEFGIDIIPVDREMADLAHTAFTRYGTGTGHPAQLNYGDLFAYALAKSRNIPLLFKGADFAATDVIAAT